MKKSEQSEKSAESLRKAAPFMGLGVQLAGIMVAMFFLGNWLDGKLELFPVLTILFSILGAFAGIYNFIKIVLNLNRNDKKH